MGRASQETRSELGLVQVYTGKGKGKTTAALGLAFRAAGRGLEILMVQFLKPAENYGEHMASEAFPNFTILPMGLSHMVSGTPRGEDIEMARQALQRARDEMHSGKYDLVILDEVNVAMGWKLLDPSEVLDALKGRPENVEVVLTGRGAPQEIIDYADLVTEMTMIKHPFDKGVPARRGIEY